MNHSSNPRIRRGSSMIEVVISSLLSGVVVVGALNVMGGAIKTKRAIATHWQGPRLANELLAEVMSRSFEDPETPGTGPNFGYGLEPGEAATRSTFDDLDDYADWNASPPIDSNDVPMPEYVGWTRQVSWNIARRDNGGFWFMKTGLKRVVVTVTAPDGTVTTRYGYRCKEGVLERSPAVNSEIVTWVGAELQIGMLGSARAGTNHTNQPTD